MPKKYFNKNAGLTYIGKDPKPVKIIHNDFLNKIVYEKMKIAIIYFDRNFEDLIPF